MAYIAIECVSGATLDEAARRMTLEEKVRVMQKSAEGLHAAHRVGLIHRDVKPGNILVERTDDGEWRPYVTDFGLAREVERPGLTMTVGGLAVGTPQYMAPEQARGEVGRLDRRVDVYGLGVTLYEILAGHPPFSGASVLDVFLQVVSADPPSLRASDPSIPRDLETIVLKCLEKDPARRYDSARALAEDLGRYL